MDVYPQDRNSRLIFASASPAEELKKIGLRFIGFVKTITLKYPKQYLSEKVLEKSGDFRYVVRLGQSKELEMMDVGWVDRERRQFIATMSSPLRRRNYTRNILLKHEEGPIRE